MRPFEINRRTLLAELATLIAGLSAAGCRKSGAPPDAGPALSQADRTQPQPEHALLPLQRAVLAAACARVLPTDEDPGAAEADVIEYLDRELARPELATIKTNVLAGVTALNRLAGRASGKSFVDLGPSEQDEVLHRVQRASERGRDFLFILTVLTLEGFLGDPRWGGNRGGVGWKLIGYGPGSVDGAPVHGH